MTIHQLPVEVEKHGGLFEACVVDLIDEIQSSLKVVYKRYSKTDEVVSSKIVKLPWNCQSESFVKGQTVEVYYFRGDLGPHGPGWWPAIVSGRKSSIPYNPIPDKYTIRLKNTICQDVCLDKKYIRTPNPNSPIDALCKFFIVVPEQYKHLVTQFSFLKKFQMSTSIPICEYTPEDNKLNIISFVKSRPKAMIAKEVLSDFMNLCKDAIISETNDGELIRTETEDSDESNSSDNEEVTEPKDLIGLSMGGEASTIQQVRSISGVTRVRYDERTNIFKINGESSSIVIARNLLKYHEKTIELPQDFVDLLMYENGNIMQEIINKSELIRIEMEDLRHNAKLQNITLLLVGTSESITETEFLIQLMLSGWKVQKAIECNQRELPPVDKQVKDLPTLTKYDLFQDEVRIPEDILSIVKDQKDININLARKIHDIITIDEDNNDRFLQIDIIGKTESAVSEARKLLNFVDDSSYHIRPRMVGKVIGKRGYNVRSIMQRSNVIRIEVLESKPRLSDGKIPVRLIGLSDRIKLAKKIIEEVVNE